ncbi:Fanconi anemia group I protein [Stomoxys calcitrans]|uniref:Fanconi anemia group I protein n=1 Tax=Stomoxys calcitrans TaxID=35570 RepID=UPI0027E23728|nr:Fanconi anemia group I protein [Stomoxys calcitrans]
MASGSKQPNLETQIIRLGEKHNIAQLQVLIDQTSSKQLTTLLGSKLGRHDCTTLWNYLLQGFNPNNFDSREKRFACVKCFLDGLLKVELTYKQMYDLITRLCQDLNTFSSEHLVEILEHCIDGLRMGDPKCVGWKDLLPETLHVLATLPQLSVNGISMSGSEYRDTTVKNLCAMKWPTEVMTPIADMFKEIHLTPSETVTVLNKFSGSLQSLSPDALPALSYQLFSMCSTASQIIIPILALEKYFHRFYYKKLFDDMSSNSTDFDSIDAFSDRELREAEETILHHLNYCTQYKINEIQMSIVLRNFVAMPDVVLTPFVLSAILSMTSANREPDSRLSSSILLPFLRTVVKHNQDESALSDYSVWCRDSLHRKQVNLEQIFTVLIDQNKDGKDTITPGLVNLSFVLLKAKNSPQLNELATGFLTKFIRKRFVFGQGIVRKLAEWMVVEQEQNQYAECLTLLSVADTFTVSECVKTINYVMDYFLWLPGDQAMRMMSFILPILKISALVRDAFIEILRKAMSSCEMGTRRMAVYGFCMILKQLNNSNSQRSQMSVSGMCTQHSISGISLMSQTTLGNRNNPQRHFDMLTLEIIGVLRSCFHQTLDIKICLYENLQRAVELNPKLVPHVLQFIDWHFRSFFVAPLEEDEENQFSVKFDKVVAAKDFQESEIEIYDNLGKLMIFVSHCLVIFEKFENEYDTREIKRLLKLCMEKVIGKQIKFESMTGSLTHLKNELIMQQLNFIEGLMAHSLLTSKQTNENVKQLLPLFKEHELLTEGLKSLSHKKGQKKTKANNDNEISNVTINGVPVRKILSKAENIWDLGTIERFLRLLHEDIVPFAPRHETSALRSRVSLVNYVLEVAAAKVAQIRLEPAYKQLSHSKRTLKYLTDITKVVYERCVKRLPDLWRNFDMQTASLAMECFRQCVQTANEVYKAKFQTIFIKGFDFHMLDKSKECISVLQDVMDEFMKEEFADDQNPNESLMSDTNGRKIPPNILLSLEVLYDNISFGNRMTIESYNWLLKFCKNYEVNAKEMGIVHKLLFKQRQKTHSGAFFQSIPEHLAKIWSHIKDEEAEPDAASQVILQLKSITEATVESCLHHLYDSLRKQIEDVDYFIIKANNLAYKCRIVPEDDRDFCLASLKSLERSISLQLVHISNTLRNLTNVCIPLGNSMDGLMKLLMQHYICLKNLTKHFLNCCSGGVKVSIQGTKFDSLLHVVGKPLPSNIYALITYIESNILEDNAKKKSNPQADKAKVLRETKFIPKIILCIENFNKHVILLAKKTNDRLANFLHFGTVRDFRIKTSDLKAAIDRTLSHSSQIEASESGDEEADEGPAYEVEDSNETILRELEDDVRESQIAANKENIGDVNDPEEDNDERSSRSRSSTPSSVSTKTKKSQKKPETKASKKKEETKKAETLEKKTGKKAGVSQKDKPNKKLQPVVIDEELEPNNGDNTFISPEDAETLEHESDRDSCTQLMKNLAKINAKTAKKRSLRESEQQGDPDVLCAPPLEPLPKKSRRGRKK